MLRPLSAIGFCSFLIAILGACAVPQSGAPAGVGYGAGQGAQEPREIALKQLLRQQARLWNVGYPMLTASAELCGARVRQNFGFWAWTRWDVRRRYRTASMGAYGLDDHLRVVHILPGSPAAEAGLAAGDIIKAVGWQAMATGRKASAGLQRILEAETRSGRPLELHVLRRGQEHVFEIVPEAQCGYALVLTESEEINVFSEGTTIFVTVGLLRFAKSDRHLAVLVGHELAHRVLGHEPEKSMTGELAAVLRELRASARDPETGAAYVEAGIRPNSEPYGADSELEADDLGLRFVARAGYSLDGAADIWRRIAAQGPKAMLLPNFHPTTPDRLRAIEQSIERISAKKTTVLPLVPGS